MPPFKVRGLVLGGALLLTACSSSASPTTSPAVPSAAASAQASATGAAVEIKNTAFNPASITVKAGTQVTWTNSDGFAHTVTMDQGTDTSGNLAQGATYQLTFSAAGSFTYPCTIHASMHGTIVVTQ